MVARDRGEYAEAVEHCSRSVAFARSSGDRRVERITGWIFGYVLTGLGRHEDARVHAEHSLRISREIGDQRGESLALGTLGMLHHASGEPDRAKDHYERALVGLQEMGFLLVEGLARLLLGQLELQQGRVDTAASHFTRAAEVGREINAPAAFVPAGALLACLNPAGLRSALAALKEHESRLDPSSRMLTRFLLYRATSDPAHVEEAYRILQVLRERAPEIYRESMIERVPLHREIVAAWEGARDVGSEQQ
jgi:tetratricopeptide (TPR) repeat protein